QTRHEGITPGLIGLIPVYGHISYIQLPKRRNTANETIRHTFSIKNIGKKALINVELTFLAVIILVPIIYIFGMAFSETLSDIPNTIWPETPSLNGIKYIFGPDSKFGTWYLNTLIIAVINMFIGTIII